MNNKELDRLAAEKVMGWTMSGITSYFDGDRYTKFSRDTFTPTTDMNHAMMVIREMVASEWEVTMSLHGDLSWCHLGRNLTKDWRKAELHQETGTKDELPRVVLIACLRAQGVEV